MSTMDIDSALPGLWPSLAFTMAPCNEILNGPSRRALSGLWPPSASMASIHRDPRRARATERSQAATRLPSGPRAVLGGPPSAEWSSAAPSTAAPGSPSRPPPPRMGLPADLPRVAKSNLDGHLHLVHGGLSNPMRPPRPPARNGALVMNLQQEEEERDHRAEDIERPQAILGGRKPPSSSPGGHEPPSSPQGGLLLSPSNSSAATR